MECDFCKTGKGIYWIHQNTKVLCEDCHGLFNAVKNPHYKKMLLFSQYEEVEDSTPTEDFSGMQVINRLPGKTTKF